MTTRTFDISTTQARATFVEYMMDSAVPTTAERFQDTNFTFVILKFPDGWQTEGHSVCVNDADYNPTIGETIAVNNARANAETHYWRSVGYLAMIGQTEVTVPWNV